MTRSEDDDKAKEIRDSTEPVKPSMAEAAVGSRDDDGFWEQFLRGDDDDDGSPAPVADLTGKKPSWSSPVWGEDSRSVFARGWTTPTEPAVQPMGQSTVEARDTAPGGVSNDGFWEQFFLDDDGLLVLPAADPTVDYAAMLVDSVDVRRRCDEDEAPPAVSESDDEQLLELTFLTRRART
ncbi:unnamed protein product [Urochloa humidicola]